MHLFFILFLRESINGFFDERIGQPFLLERHADLIFAPTLKTNLIVDESCAITRFGNKPLIFQLVKNIACLAGRSAPLKEFGLHLGATMFGGSTICRCFIEKWIHDCDAIRIRCSPNISVRIWVFG